MLQMRKQRTVKIAAVLLVVTMFAWLLPLNVQAVWAETDQNDFLFDASTKTITGYTGSGGDAVIPDQINGVPAERIGSLIFDEDDCENPPESVSIPAGVKEIEAGAFGNCSTLKEITVAAENPYYSSEDGVLFDKEKSALIQYPMGRTGTAYAVPESVKAIEDEAFAGCSGLEQVSIPAGVKEIGTDVFFSCKSLKSVAIPYGVTTIKKGTFNLCSGLSEVVIPNSVTAIKEYAFGNCTGLVSIKIPDSVTSIDANAFSGQNASFTICGYSSSSAAAQFAMINGFRYTNLGPKAQYISGASSFTKTYGCGAFSLGAKTSGNGVLTYKSDSTGVAAVNAGGTVSVKGTGIANIIITAAGTSAFTPAKKTVTIKVVPKGFPAESQSRKKDYDCKLEKGYKSQRLSGYICTEQEL